MNGKTLMLLHRFLQSGHKIGLGVYTNSTIIKDILEKEYGFPCTLIQLKPDRENRIVNTKLLILDDIERYLDHKPKPKLKIKGGRKYNVPKYWHLYDTKEIIHKATPSKSKKEGEVQ